MRNRSPSIAFAMLATALLLLSSGVEPAVRGASAAGSPAPVVPVITNAAGFGGLSAQEANRAYPLRLTGVVTLVDRERNLLVLQDASGAVPLEFSLTNLNIAAGERVTVTGASGMPRSTAFPEFPCHPDERELRGSFEMETNKGVYSLARLRGFLHPPKDGYYTFWLASKASSELWLSTNADPGQSVRIASVPMGRGTSPRQWNRNASQTSPQIFLRAGSVCYLEAVREQRGGRDDNLAVAWQGPDLPQSVIAAEFLSPWGERADTPSGGPGGRTNGILQEMWADYFVGSVEPLTTRGPLSSPVVVSAPRFEPGGGAAYPEPIHLLPGGGLAREDQFRWTEMEGTVGFVGRDGDTLTMDLAEGSKQTRVSVSGWPQADLPRWENARVRVRGVCEPALDAQGNLIAGKLRVPSPAEVTRLNATVAEWAGLKRTPISQLSPTNPDLAWNRRIRVRGAVTRRDDGALLIQGPASFWAYLSRDGTNWEQVAPPVEIDLGANPQAGMVATSLSRETLARATFDGVEGMRGVGRQVEVHDSVPLGSASLADSIYTIEGGGLGIASAFDEFHFAHQPLGDSTEIVARLQSLEAENPRAHAGIMVRENLESISRCVALTVTPGRGALLQMRRKEGARGEIVELAGYAAPCWLKLARREFTLVAQPQSGAPVQTGAEVEVTGLLEWEAGQPILREARCLDLLPPSVRATVNASSDAGKVLPIGEVIPREGMGLRDGAGVATVQGVVTFFGTFEKANHFCIQDESGAALIRLSGRFARRPLQVGQRVEIEIKSVNGKWPVPFEPGRINVLGGGQLPEPVAHPAEYSLPLRGEGRWVELDGIVRSAAPDGTLTVMAKDGALPVWISGLPKNSGSAYLDSRVRVRGTMSRSEAGSPVLLVPSPVFVQIVEPPPESPFAIPAIRIAELKQMKFSPALTHRLKAGGLVTYKEDALLLVQDETGGVRVQTSGSPGVALGESVEAVGFPEPGGGFFKLSGALVKKAAATAAFEPATKTVEELLDGNFDATLVRVRAVLLDRRTREQKQLLELQSGQRIIQAVLAKDNGELPDLPLGGVVELTGVCWAERLSGAGDAKPTVSSFQLLLRSPADVVLLQRPPWWTWKHTAALVGVLLMVLVGALIWIYQLRRKVAGRTQALRATMARLEEETKTSATLAERNRLAAEIHDGLEQGLNGIMMQLDGVETKLSSTPDAAKHHLDLARKMVRFSRTEVRHSLWDWKAPALADHDLKTALSDIVSQMAESNIARVAVEVAGTSYLLPPATEHHLLRICQEALTNALKHAQARNIAVKLNYTADVVELSVRDDGRGFVPGTVLNGMVGHLGLQNLRSRARKLGGELAVTSEPGKGATITVRIPCATGDTQPE